jgi:DNA-directed RNA polymerase subunit RPC12/RpoP
VSKRVRCKTCGKQFTRNTGSNRLNCEVCKPPRVAAPVVSAEVPPVPRGPGPIEAATAHELARVKRVTTVSGAIAMRLARVMDDPDLSEARLTALAAQLERTLEKATAGTPPPPDDLDARQERIRLIQDTA